MNLRYTLTREMLIQFTEFMLLRGSGFAEAQWTARKRSGLWMGFWLVSLFIYAFSGIVAEGGRLSFMVLLSLYLFGKSLYDILADTSRALKLVHQRAAREVDRRPPNERGEEVELRVLADYFIVSSPRVQLALRPDQISGIYYDDQLIYFFYQSDRAVIVPQAAFGGDEARNAFFGYLYGRNPSLYQATHRIVIKDLIPKEGFFNSPVKIVASSLGAIGLGLVFLVMASPLIFEKMHLADLGDEEGETRPEYDITSILTRVDDAGSLARVSLEEQRGMYWTPMDDSPPGQVPEAGAETSAAATEVRCLVTMEMPRQGFELSPEQLAAFTALKRDYQALKPRLMAALLAAHQFRRADLALYQRDSELSAADLPDIKTPEELAGRLVLKSLYLSRLHRDGLALSCLKFKSDWNDSNFYGDIGVTLLGDKIIYAGRNPELYLNLDLSKEAVAEPAPAVGSAAEAAGTT